MVDAKVYKLKSAFVKNSVFITLSYVKENSEKRPIEILQFANSLNIDALHLERITINGSARQNNGIIPSNKDLDNWFCHDPTIYFSDMQDRYNACEAELEALYGDLSNYPDFEAGPNLFLNRPDPPEPRPRTLKEDTVLTLEGPETFWLNHCPVCDSKQGNRYLSQGAEEIMDEYLRFDIPESKYLNIPSKDSVKGLFPRDRDAVSYTHLTLPTNREV